MTDNKAMDSKTTSTDDLTKTKGTVELSEDQLGAASGGITVTKQVDKSSPALYRETLG